jgi:hypothetical protein
MSLFPKAPFDFSVLPIYVARHPCGSIRRGEATSSDGEEDGGMRTRRRQGYGVASSSSVTNHAVVD